MDTRRIFAETEVEHARRLYRSYLNYARRLPPGARRQTKMRRWTLRLKRQAHEQGRSLTDSEVKGILGSNGTWVVAAMSIEELERELNVRWNNQSQRYDPA
ncbi:MAG: hypothetical protein J7M17_07370 [Anaerolineae bacterium]|nr:hypothetical protein [Anaerolineae bacterium]